MFEPLRFNEKLKAKPGTAHLQHTKTPATTQAIAAAGIKTPHAHTHADPANAAQPTAAQPGAASTTDEAASGKLADVHETVEGVAGVELTPPHPPREDTPEYVKTHHHLALVLDTPCAICGVRNSTLNDPKHNLFGSKAIETHHYPVERSLLDACDPAKIAVVFPQVKDHASLEAFIDSEGNMMVLCDVHHRHPLYGIHHLVSQDFFIQPFLYGGYEVAADSKDAAAAMAADEKIVKEHLTADEIAHG